MNNEERTLNTKLFKDSIFVLGRMCEFKRLGLLTGPDELNDKGNAQYVELRHIGYKPKYDDVIKTLKGFMGEEACSEEEFQKLAGMVLDVDTDFEAFVKKMKDRAENVDEDMI